jgi:hypothetical protein
VVSLVLKTIPRMEITVALAEVNNNKPRTMAAYTMILEKFLMEKLKKCSFNKKSSRESDNR